MIVTEINFTTIEKVITKDSTKLNKIVWRNFIINKTKDSKNRGGIPNPGLSLGGTGVTSKSESLPHVHLPAFPNLSKFL